ncbi:MAG: hypothetical protein SWJ54_01605 [Cyanobacteriota bacterium]|nr:hypothetical protein [Cyanobacteriota bacterium]
MFEVSPDHATLAAALLAHYSFDVGNYSSEEMVQEWGMNHEYYWIYLAIVEALYQGRYKSVSVEQILSIWLRRGKPLYHFNLEFEQLICRDLPQSLTPARTEEVNTPLIEVEVIPAEEPRLFSSSSSRHLKPFKPETKPRFPTRPPRTSVPIHTDFLTKLKQILENSQKTLPPVNYPPKNRF